MIYPMRISLCTSTIETAVYENRTHGDVRGRELVTPSYSIKAAGGLRRTFAADAGYGDPHVCCRGMSVIQRVAVENFANTYG